MNKNIIESTKFNLVTVAVFLLLNSCQQKNSTSSLFELLPPESTGIDFENKLVENDTFNVLEFDYLYNGGGVAIGDFNNDGLPDVFFTGNQVSCGLYLNQGNMKFKEVTQEAGLITRQWAEGVTLVDLNNDGFLDIYLSVSSREKQMPDANMLFINVGPDENGIPIFEEQAS